MFVMLLIMAFLTSVVFVHLARVNESISDMETQRALKTKSFGN
jgi:hypothetical protein